MSPESVEAWQAVIDLHGCRSRGMGIEPIGPADMVAWCDIHEVPQWRRPWFWRIVRACDAVILRMEDARSAKPPPNN